jgi:glyoxylase-like metal-dependent hydrolase (beta-lactamase superfamily II)
MKTTHPRLASLLAVLLLAIGAVSTMAQEAERDIERIAGEVYRFRNNFHYSVFAVTPEGIIATDPINAGAAEWLKTALQRRFNQPVKYLIYSHEHPDHISGGEVFADTAIVVAHERTKAKIIGEQRRTAVPHLTFTDRVTIELGGTTVELSYVGRNHSDNSIVMRFPKERLLFAVDFIPVEAVAFRDFHDAYIEEWIDSLERVERLDFDILVPGHGRVGTRDHVRQFREYMQDLYGEVLKHARAGASLEEMQRTIRLPKYEKWFGYQSDNPRLNWFPMNIAGMYRYIQNHRRPN